MEDTYGAMLTFMPVYVVPYPRLVQRQPCSAALLDTPESVPEKKDEARLNEETRQTLIKLYDCGTWLKYEEGLWLRCNHFELFDD